MAAVMPVILTLGQPGVSKKYGYIGAMKPARVKQFETPGMGVY
jgi:hypothetical protein